MRWAILILVALVSASLFLAWKHPTPATLGARLAERLEHDGTGPGPLRGAIQIFDFSPDPSTRTTARGLSFRTAPGDLPGSSLFSRPHHFWAEHDADASSGEVQFSWEARPATEPLRDLLSAPPNAQRLRDALLSLNLSDGDIDRALAAASSTTVISDEDVLGRFLHADRDTLITCDDLSRAAAESLCLLALPDDRPVLAFRCADGAGNTVTIYSLTLPTPPDRNAASLELHAYDSAKKMLWRGILNVDGSDHHAPEPAQVRLWALAMAQLATAPPASAPSELQPGTPATFQFFGQ